MTSKVARGTHRIEEALVFARENIPDEDKTAFDALSTHEKNSIALYIQNAHHIANGTTGKLKTSLESLKHKRNNGRLHYISVAGNLEKIWLHITMMVFMCMLILMIEQYNSTTKRVMFNYISYVVGAANFIQSLMHVGSLFTLCFGLSDIHTAYLRNWHIFGIICVSSVTACQIALGALWINVGRCSAVTNPSNCYAIYTNATIMIATTVILYGIPAILKMILLFTEMYSTSETYHHYMNQMLSWLTGTGIALQSDTQSSKTNVEGYE